jgi:hypothetical protein
MKRAIIEFEWTGNDELYLRKLDGNCSFSELNWALDWLKQQMVTGRMGPSRQIQIPGMLGPDLKRLPSDVQRRMANIR